MGAEPISEKESKDMKRTITKPRPGHADLNGAIKYGHRDIRNVLERSSKRNDSSCSWCSCKTNFKRIRRGNCRTCS